MWATEFSLSRSVRSGAVFMVYRNSLPYAEANIASCLDCERWNGWPISTQAWIAKGLESRNRRNANNKKTTKEKQMATSNETKNAVKARPGTKAGQSNEFTLICALKPGGAERMRKLLADGFTGERQKKYGSHSHSARLAFRNL